MTEISVSCLIPYNAEVKKSRTEAEWDAIHMKRVIKNEALNHSFSFSINGISTRIDRNNLPIFKNEINRRFRQKIIADHPYPVCIVPVPNGDGVLGQDNKFRTLQIAQAIAANGVVGTVALDLLRWNEPVGKAHLNQRARNVDDHLQALRITGKTELPIVLFDDVLTTGSQMTASVLKLREAGYNVVGCYTVFEVVEAGAQIASPGWKVTTRNLARTPDLFANFA
jgi:hypothetical protein